MPGSSFPAETRRLAYDQTAGAEPGIVFLGGFRSSKDGDKALYLEDWAKRRGQAFLRFDYSGHGGSSGSFTDGTISQWTEDAETIITALTSGPQVIVGSSMGGWIGLLLLRRIPERIAGLATIAGAPDFTESHYFSSFDQAAHEELEREGVVYVESPYDDDPYPITQKLIEDGRKNLIFEQELSVSCPLRILHGTDDASIPVQTAQRLFDHAEGPDTRMTLVKGADHRFSTPDCLDLITDTVEQLLR